MQVSLFFSDNNKLEEFLIIPQISEHLLGNGHCVINLGYSSDEYLHIMYGAHATNPYYISLPISEIKKRMFFNSPPEADIWPEKLTYPQFYLVDNKTLLFYRAQSDLYISVYNSENKKWKDLYNGPFLKAGDSYSSVYMDRLAIQDKKINISWVYRLKMEDSNKVINDGIYMLHSEDGGISWRDNQGIFYSPPITKEMVSKTIPISLEAGLINQNSSAFGMNDKLYLVHHYQDINGISQIFLSVVNQNGLICQEVVSQNKIAFDLIGKGTLLLPLSRPEIAVSEKNIHVIYREKDNLIITSKPLSQVCDEKWSFFSPETQPLGGYEPNYDIEFWNKERKLVLYIQGARQGPGDKAILGPAEPAFLYEFQEIN